MRAAPPGRPRKRPEGRTQPVAPAEEAKDLKCKVPEEAVDGRGCKLSEEAANRLLGRLGLLMSLVEGGSSRKGRPPDPEEEAMQARFVQNLDDCKAEAARVGLWREGSEAAVVARAEGQVERLGEDARQES